jgi:hypothetical protein
VCSIPLASVFTNTYSDLKINCPTRLHSSCLIVRGDLPADEAAAYAAVLAMNTLHSTTHTLWDHNAANNRPRPSVVVHARSISSSNDSSISRGSSNSRRSYRKRDTDKASNHTIVERKQSTPAAVPAPVAADELGCVHFDSCPGCSQQQQLHDPPIVSRAREFFASRQVHLGASLPKCSSLPAAAVAVTV